MSNRIRSRSAAILALLAAPLALGAQTPDLPPRKAGLWEISTSPETSLRLPGAQAFKTQECVDTGSDRDLMHHGMGLMGQCKSVTTKRAADSYVVESQCALGPASFKTRTEITGDLDSAYTMRTEGSGSVATRIANWKSADCAGISPGEVSVAGIKIHIKQIKGFIGASGRIVDKLPPRRAGQWEVSYEQEIPIPRLLDSSPDNSQSGLIRLPSTRMCIDRATDGAAMELGLGLIGGCAGEDIKRVGNEWVQDDRCELLKMAKKITISGDFQTSITVHTAHSIGLLDRPLTTIERRTARWIGETCADGMVPGDIVLHGKAKLNVTQPFDAVDSLKEALRQVLPTAVEKLLSPPTDNKK